MGLTCKGCMYLTPEDKPSCIIKNAPWSADEIRCLDYWEDTQLEPLSPAETMRGVATLLTLAAGVIETMTKAEFEKATEKPLDPKVVESYAELERSLRDGYQLH